MSENVMYVIKDGLMEVRESSQSIVWSGLVDGAKSLAVLDIPGSSDAIVLLEVGTRDKYRNVLRIRKDGSVVWRAPAPPSFGPYWKVEMEHDQLVAWSWSCYRLSLDLESGEITESVFTK